MGCGLAILCHHRDQLTHAARPDKTTPRVTTPVARGFSFFVMEMSFDLRPFYPMILAAFCGSWAV